MTLDLDIVLLIVKTDNFSIKPTVNDNGLSLFHGFKWMQRHI